MGLGVVFEDAPAAERKASKKHKKDKKSKQKSSKSHNKSKGKQNAGTGSEDNSSGSSGDEGRGTEPAPGTAAPGSGLEREAWMTQPMARPHAEPSKEEAEAAAAAEAAAKAKAEADAEPVVGLRVMKPGGGNPHADAGSAPPRPVVGDGGLSWRLKALKRAQEQAAAAGGDVAAVVADRWGSLHNLTSTLTDGRAADSKAHLHAARQRERGRDGSGTPAGAVGATSSGSSGRPHYLSDLRSSERPQMKRPSVNESLSWRRRGSLSGREGSVTAPAGSGGQPTTSTAGDDGAAAERDGSRGRERGATLESVREEEGEGHGQEGAWRRDDRRGGSPGRRRQGDGREGRRDGGSDRHRRDDRDGDRRGGRDDRGPPRHDDRRRERDDDPRSAHRDRPYESSRLGWDGRPAEREGGGGRGGRGGMSSEQAAALGQVAGSLNQFASDGNFLDRFQQQRPSRDEKARDEPRNGTAEAGSGARGARPAGPRGEARVRDQAAAERMREEMRQLRAGMARGGGGEEGEEGEDPLEGGGSGAGDRGAEEVDTDMEDAPAPEDTRAGDDQRGSDRHAGRPPRHDRPRRPSPPPPPAPATGNKSVADMLRARLKGLPVPESAPAPLATTSSPPGASGRAPRLHACSSSSQLARMDTDGPGPSRAPVSLSRGEERRGHVGSGSGDDPHDMSDDGDERHRTGGDGGGGGGGKKQVVALPLVDATGRAVKGAFGREAAGQTAQPGGRPPKRTQRYDESGQRVRYFGDDDGLDLDTLVKRTKYGDDHDNAMDRTVANNIMRKARFKQAEMDVDDEYDHDGGLELYEGRARKGNAEQQASREKARQVAAFNRANKAEQQCMYCLSNPKRPTQLTISMAGSVYLMLPPKGRLAPGHCCIVPKDHISSLRQVDDSVWTEIKNFVKCLIQMWAAQGKDVIFWETAMHLGNFKRHAILEAVPVSGREFASAPGYFKKAMQEAESEWSVHHAKAVIETTAKKGLRESIPPNFPYLYVQFGYGSGFVHVIDDETKFDAQLGRQVLVGLLRLPPEEMHKRAAAESASTQQQWARDFVSQWAPYDWTLQL